MPATHANRSVTSAHTNYLQMMLDLSRTIEQAIGSEEQRPATGSDERAPRSCGSAASGATAHSDAEIATLTGPLLNTYEIKQTCARWLTWRRVQLGLPPLATAIRLGIPRHSLLLLEFGMAESKMLPGAARLQLSQILAGADRNPAWINAVVAGALGDTVMLDRTTLAMIQTDLINAPLLSHVW